MIVLVRPDVTIFICTIEFCNCNYAGSQWQEESRQRCVLPSNSQLSLGKGRLIVVGCDCNCLDTLLQQVLYSDVVKLLPEEVERVSELMEEKELRLRAPLEEVKLLLTANEAAQHQSSVLT